MNKEISPVGTFVGEVGTMPGTTGFTMACFKAADVPFGTKLYINTQPEQQPERRLYEATRDAAVETLLDLGYSYFGRMQWNPPSKAPEPSVTEELLVPSSKVLEDPWFSPADDMIRCREAFAKRARESHGWGIGVTVDECCDIESMEFVTWRVSWFAALKG